MRVAVVGATGMIGRAVAGGLLARGDEVLAVSRGGRAGIDGARDVRWDPAEGPPPPAALEADAVVNVAGSKNDLLPWTASRKREFHESRVGTTRLLAEALGGEGGPRTLVNASGADYYGPREAPADESAPPGEGFLADVCAAWERAAVRAEGRGVRVVRLRTGIVLSAQGGALPQMARPVRLFAGGPLGEGRQWIPWIHVDDQVGLNLLALDDDALAGPVNTASPGIVRQRRVREGPGRRAPPARGAAGAGDRGAPPAGREGDPGPRQPPHRAARRARRRLRLPLHGRRARPARPAAASPRAPRGRGAAARRRP